MLILLDKNVPYGLRQFLRKHQVLTVAEKDWGELENGDLLKAAEKAKFDLMITADQNIKYQQNLSSRKIALIVLGSNQWPLVKLRSAEIAAANHARPGSFYFLEILHQ